MKLALAVGMRMCMHTLNNAVFLWQRQSNPDIQAWMKKQGFTDYAKLEEYYENKYIYEVHNITQQYD